MKEEKPEIKLTDKESLSELYVLYFKKLYRLCYFHTQDVEESKEIVHDVFLSLWERKDQLIITSSFEAYLVKAVKNKVLQCIRKKINRENYLASIAGHSVTAENQTENTFFFNMLTKQVEQLVAQLPPQCRKVFQLSREQGLSNVDIASQLNVSEKAVEHQITRALSFLRKQLAGYL